MAESSKQHKPTKEASQESTMSRLEEHFLLAWNYEKKDDPRKVPSWDMVIKKVAELERSAVVHQIQSIKVKENYHKNLEKFTKIEDVSFDLIELTELQRQTLAKEEQDFRHLDLPALKIELANKRRAEMGFRKRLSSQALEPHEKKHDDDEFKGLDREDWVVLRKKLSSQALEPHKKKHDDDEFKGLDREDWEKVKALYDGILGEKDGVGSEQAMAELVIRVIENRQREVDCNLDDLAKDEVMSGYISRWFYNNDLL